MTRLTPIQIRGKRKPKPTTARTTSALVTQSSKHHLQDHVPADSPSQRTKRSLSDALAHRKMMRPRSHIENLPVEVLELILLYCRSFALPRASQLIGAKLSGKATLFKLFFAAFHETWHQGFGETADLPFIYNVDARNPFPLRGRQGDPELQTEMLSLPWVDLNFLLEAQQLWADKYARDRIYHHWMGRPGSRPNIYHDEDHTSPAAISETRPSRFDARACFEADYHAARIPPMDWVMRPKRMMDVHPLTRVPTRLITGPWTEEDRRRLFWITRAGATGHTTAYNHAPWETRVEGIRNMFIRAPEPDDFVFSCLTGTQNLSDDTGDFWLYDELPADVVGDMVDEISKRLDWGDDTQESKETLRRTSLFLRGSVSRSEWRRAPTRRVQ
ncbi:hypothetical protein NLU13_4194 [Sarocladium strictum]|uniref:Uncharacterized protein n=1 Tax=Sarocladium strictum TaxID=5046 RepID=A0AA39L8K9_SARSR|nr:hypothetical protein NLU13_4194 [Sarocladium strictum]